MTTQNNNQTDYKLRDLMNLVKRELMLEFNCHAIGTIQSFDTTKQTAKVSLNYLKTFQQIDAAGKPQTVSVAYPLLIDCPVIVLSDGFSAGLTFPVKTGAICKVFFNDRDIDTWFQSGQIAPNATSRAHAITDAIVLVGLRSAQNPITDYDADLVRLYNGSTELGLSTTKVRVKNQLTDLRTAVEYLINTLEAIFASATNTPGNPISPGAAAVLEQAKLVFRELLE